MRIHIWHGYLLSGTGSNEYTRALARTLSQQGHDVTVFCQDPDPAAFDMGGAKVIRPVLPGPLPVFVLDAYADAQPALIGDLDQRALEEFVQANAAAIREAGPADLLIANHVLLGGPVGAASGLPFIVKAHGSELEYAMRPNPALRAWARQTLTGCLQVVAGSEHVARVVVDLVGIPESQVCVIPPGVDTDEMRPLSRPEALAGLLAECAADGPNAGDPRHPDDGNAERLSAFLAQHEQPVIYVGKLSHEKGVPLLADVLRDLRLPAVLVGFGPARTELEPTCGRDILFTGPLQHRHLRYLWPLGATSVAPSVFPEAFGMVAAEAASCGCPPLVADHSGLAEIASGLRGFVPSHLADLVSFPRDDALGLTDRLRRILALPAADRAALQAGARRAAVELWSWDSVGQRLTGLAERLLEPA